MIYSVIIPVYNRPEDIKTLLESLSAQTTRQFEVIVVEDGSSIPCENEAKAFSDRLDLTYIFQQNTGQGFARNTGINAAKGNFFVFFDSDCCLPPDYFEELDKAIIERKLDAFGGPDTAADGFSAVQKAMNFSMTSFWTTGGIRGKLKDVSAYQARGYNMGFSRPVFEQVGGFVDANKAEDIEISLRIRKAGFRLELVREAFVYHRRKNTIPSFFRQSFQFGRNRIHVSRRHPEALGLVHLLPLLFLLGILALPMLSLFSKFVFCVVLAFYAAWGMGVFVSSSWASKSLWVGLLALVTSVGQLVGYGLGITWEKVAGSVS